MDLDVFASAHRAEWDRLDDLLRRHRRLTGAEADELVTLYQRAATHLSQVQSSAPDPAVTGHLTSLVARARSAVTGARTASWRDAVRFFTAGFPAAVYRSRQWWVPTALLCTVVAALIGWWVGTHPEVRSTIGAPEHLREMTRPGGQYEAYYSSHPATSFAAQVWTNNAQAAAICLVFGAFLGLPVLWVLFQNVLSLGIGLGLMESAGRLDTFLGLLLPHGLLELTAVFVAMRHWSATRMDGHRPGPAQPQNGTGGGGPLSGRHGHRPGGRAVRLRCHRSLRHPFRPADLGSSPHRSSRRSSLPDLRLCPRPTSGEGRRNRRHSRIGPARRGTRSLLMCGGPQQPATVLSAPENR